MNIYEKMLAITAEVQNIEKRGHNDFNNYDYVRATDVIANVQKSLVKNKVYLQISEMEYASHNEEKKDGKINHFGQIKCRAMFVNAEKPEEKIEVEYYAEAADSLDKQIYKAKTNGLKYLLTQAFMLVTDVLIDAESDHSTIVKDAEKRQEAKPTTSVKVESSIEKCEVCGAEVAGKVKEFSVNKFHKMLCFKCQKTYKPGKVNKLQEEIDKDLSELKPKFTDDEKAPF